MFNSKVRLTKANYIKYHREVSDKYGKPLKVGDMVIFPDGYFNDCHIGIIYHFTEENVIIVYRETKFSQYLRAQRHNDRVIKIADGCKDYPEFTDYLDEYGKTICTLS